MSSISQLFYVSRAATEFDSTMVQSILQIARRNNAKLDITGCLLFSGRFFAQVLEGDEPSVATLSRRIAADPRHADVRVLMQGSRAVRDYGDWSMGYLHDLGLEDELEALLLHAPEQHPGAIADVMAKMNPDTIMGALR